MNKIIEACSLNSDNGIVKFDLPLPKQCPHCSVAYGSSPTASFYTIRRDYESPKFQYVYSCYFCPHCENLFFVQYYANGDFYTRNPSGFIAKVLPEYTQEASFSEGIQKLSPKFVKIYHEAEHAENIGLMEICGLGYRKALEFLVKDFAIFSNPSETDAIKSKMLAPCITDYIDNRRIKSLATASAWIGNDETHYVRKHEDYNLSHLKAFISAIVSYIDSELSYLEAEVLLKKPKK